MGVEVLVEKVALGNMEPVVFSTFKRRTYRYLASQKLLRQLRGLI